MLFKIVIFQASMFKGNTAESSPVHNWVYIFQIHSLKLTVRPGPERPKYDRFPTIHFHKREFQGGYFLKFWKNHIPQELNHLVNFLRDIWNMFANIRCASLNGKKTSYTPWDFEVFLGVCSFWRRDLFASWCLPCFSVYFGQFFRSFLKHPKT